ncbi:MAG: leishmanolysin-related zinc metalloendopeptidase [Alphaproteobacteria bacterium]|nr:leishmanolysin-related zinc metalloendopeptidase [Alphaproteobacteria bacterium]
MTDRMFDFLASLGTSPGEADLTSAMNAPLPMDLFDGEGGEIGDGLASTLPAFDGDSLGVLAADSGPAAQPGDGGDAGLSGLLPEEPLFAFDQPDLSHTEGVTTRLVSDYSQADFDATAAIRQALWHEDAAAAHIEAAGQVVPPSEAMLGEADLTIIDMDWFAKGGNGGGKGGGGNGGGDDGGGDGTLSSYVSGDPGGYNIEIVFKKAWTVDLQGAFIDSSELISDLITGDISDVRFRGKTIDDIRIDAELKEIDGEGGILGQAGPTAIRTSNYLPATAVMQFDIADASAYNASGQWQDIVFHETLHSVGFGTVWSYQELIDGAGTDNPLFTGTAATFTYNRDYDAEGATGVPLEQDGGAGTRDSHWDEETFDNEIMTGYIDDTNYLSEMTVAALEDSGYETVWDEDFFFT